MLSIASDLVRLIVVFWGRFTIHLRFY